MGLWQSKYPLDQTNSKVTITEKPSDLDSKEMMNFCLRFPDVANKVFMQLNDQTLAKCNEVGRFWKKFLNEHKQLSARKIRKYNKNHVDFKEDWDSVMVKIPLDTIKLLAISVEKFYTSLSK